MAITLGSLFDGIGGWQFAAVECGIVPVWSSEIETFPLSVTAKHFPNTKQLGDVKDINGAEIEPVDIICAGSPCQDLSVAGNRAGLKGERSGLFRNAIDIVRQMRRATGGAYPKWFVWENVPGAFSSNKGADFKSVLEEITETNIPMPRSGRWAKSGLVRSSKCDIAWRVLDAQYWGVPQRRKRIFLVADFRKERQPEVLFEPESVPWNTKEGGKQREESSRNTRESTEKASRTYCIEGNGGNPTCNQGCMMIMQGIATQSYHDMKLSDKAASLRASGGAYGGGSENYALQSTPQQCTVDFGSTGTRIYMNADKSVTLTANGGGLGAKTGLYCIRGDE